MFNSNKLLPVINAFDLGFFENYPKSNYSLEVSNHFMKVDIIECEDRFTLTTDLPGYQKSSIDIDFKDGKLTVSAERVEEPKSDSSINNPLRLERFYGKIARTFNFGDLIDSEKIVAKYENGVLNISLPKKIPLNSSTKIKLE